MRYLITGVTGQLGYEVSKELASKKNIIIAIPSREMLDLGSEEGIRNFMKSYKPDVIFNCAAYTAVDKAEEDIANCMNINYMSARIIKSEAEKLNSKLFYISTDYVFDGTKNEPYEITDYKNPRNIYGVSKSLGEDETLKYKNSFVVRTSWVFGINGKNFIKTMLNLSETKDNVNVVSDQIGSPTYAKDLAKKLIELSESDKYGIYHVTNSGNCSWADLAKYVFEKSDKKTNVTPVTSDEYPQKAIRPKYSVLSKSSLTNSGFDYLPSWENAVDRYLEEIENENKKVRVLK